MEMMLSCLVSSNCKYFCSHIKTSGPISNHLPGFWIQTYLVVGTGPLPGPGPGPGIGPGPFLLVHNLLLDLVLNHILSQILHKVQFVDQISLQVQAGKAGREQAGQAVGSGRRSGKQSIIVFLAFEISWQFLAVSGHGR